MQRIIQEEAQYYRQWMRENGRTNNSSVRTFNLTDPRFAQAILNLAVLVAAAINTIIEATVQSLTGKDVLLSDGALKDIQDAVKNGQTDVTLKVTTGPNGETIVTSNKQGRQDKEFYKASPNHP